ncbi:MAG: protein kinase, partial [Acidobacteriota bacterium]
MRLRGERRRAIPPVDATPNGTDSASSPGGRSLNADHFVGTDRFLVQRRLGAGAFGVVYEAYDRREQALVALKVLRQAEADALYRFKKGFRSLADLRHPNLVSFYELMNHGGMWFFSMELIPGRELTEAL